MTTYSLSQLSDRALLCNLTALLACDRKTTAELLAHLAEVDGRKLYLPAAYPSMFAYCVGELRLSEEAAFKRIHAARTARRFPALFEALAEGRLHLSAVVLLAPHLTADTADELLAAATHKSKSEIEQLLAERFPRPDVLAWVAAIPPSSVRQHAPGRVENQAEGPLAPGRDAAPAVPPVDAGTRDPRAKISPLSPERFALQVTIGQGTRDKLRYAQALLGHAVPSGDVAAVLDRALDALIEKLERRRFAATTRSRRSERPSTHPRHIPAPVKRTVWQRDGGQCTFVSAAGQRCPARTRLEFDHVLEVARGGQATIEGLRLRCRPHNQYQAEQTFGTEFMRHQREEALRTAAAARARAAAREQAEEVIPWLRALGFRADEARHAAARCETLPDASLEQRVRLALTDFGPRASSRGRVGSRRPGTGAGLEAVRPPGWSRCEPPVQTSHLDDRPGAALEPVGHATCREPA